MDDDGYVDVVVWCVGWSLMFPPNSDNMRTLAPMQIVPIKQKSMKIIESIQLN
jgi:hypothetical protein